MGRSVCPERPVAPLIATVDILPDSDIHSDILIERLPEPPSRCGLMPCPLSRRQSFCPCPVPKGPSDLLFSATLTTRSALLGNSHSVQCNRHDVPIPDACLPAGTPHDPAGKAWTVLQHLSTGSRHCRLPAQLAPSSIQQSEPADAYTIGPVRRLVQPNLVAKWIERLSSICLIQHFANGPCYSRHNDRFHVCGYAPAVYSDSTPVSLAGIIRRSISGRILRFIILRSYSV